MGDNLMATAVSLDTAVALLQPWILEQQAPEENRIDLALAEGTLLAAVGALVEAEWGYLAAITGLDRTTETGQLEVLYHFCEGAQVLTLRVGLVQETAVVPSLTPLIPSATMFERELREMFGITVENIPDDSLLFLPEDWPQDVYPLRKEFNQEAAGNGR